MMKVSPQEAFEKINNEQAQLIDVRTPAEYRALHAVGAENHELSILNAEYITEHILPGISNKPVLLLCKSGNRASIAAQQFQALECPNVFVVDGGTDLWDKLGLPVERGTSIISLERQVRITAGTLVFLGTLLGVFVHQYLLIIPVFVGAGLVFAGVTDTCGMGLLLARMPWNR
jgi:rhodanese-related sulfurtransferase